MHFQKANYLPAYWIKRGISIPDLQRSVWEFVRFIVALNSDFLKRMLLPGPIAINHSFGRYFDS